MRSEDESWRISRGYADVRAERTTKRRRPPVVAASWIRRDEDDEDEVMEVVDEEENVTQSNKGGMKKTISWKERDEPPPSLSPMRRRSEAGSDEGYHQVDEKMDNYEEEKENMGDLKIEDEFVEREEEEWAHPQQKMRKRDRRRSLEDTDDSYWEPTMDEDEIEEEERKKKEEKEEWEWVTETVPIMKRVTESAIIDIPIQEWIILPPLRSATPRFEKIGEFERKIRKKKEKKPEEIKEEAKEEKEIEEEEMEVKEE
ncbi:hypothetical protein PMAYCL1PPCAC_28290, partial [Pristionchus mayeri]